MKPITSLAVAVLALAAGAAGCGTTSVEDLEKAIVTRENECKHIEAEGDGVAPHVRAFRYSADSAIDRGLTQGVIESAEEKYQNKRSRHGCDELEKDKEILTLRKGHEIDENQAN